MSLDDRLFEIIKASGACTALLGTNPTRFYPDLIYDVNKKPVMPYAVHGVSTALPQNYLAGRADIDQVGSQIDIYAATKAAATAVYEAMRNALEPDENKIRVTNFSTPERDPETNAYHIRMEIDLWQNR